MITALPRRLALLSALLLGPSWLGQESLPLARAENVNNKINGKWQEFWFESQDQEVSPCGADCSWDPDSEPLGDDNIPPWTVQSSSCLILDVIEGYWGGETVFEVYDNEDSMGTTTNVHFEEGSTECWDDPTACFLDNGVSKGMFFLQRNVQHSIRIIPRKFEHEGIDGGWFRLRTVNCNSVCYKAKSVCNPTLKCCGGRVCRKGQPGGGLPRCRGCARFGEYCDKSTDCCSRTCKNKRCS